MTSHNYAQRGFSTGIQAKSASCTIGLAIIHSRSADWTRLTTKRVDGAEGGTVPTNHRVEGGICRNTGGERNTARAGEGLLLFSVGKEGKKNGGCVRPGEGHRPFRSSFLPLIESAALSDFWKQLYRRVDSEFIENCVLL